MDLTMSDDATLLQSAHASATHASKHMTKAMDHLNQILAAPDGDPYIDEVLDIIDALVSSISRLDIIGEGLEKGLVADDNHKNLLPCDQSFYSGTMSGFKLNLDQFSTISAHDTKHYDNINVEALCYDRDTLDVHSCGESFMTLVPPHASCDHDSHDKNQFPTIGDEIPLYIHPDDRTESYVDSFYDRENISIKSGNYTDISVKSYHNPNLLDHNDNHDNHNDTISQLSADIVNMTLSQSECDTSVTPKENDLLDNIHTNQRPTYKRKIIKSINSSVMSDGIDTVDNTTGTDSPETTAMKNSRTIIDSESDSKQLHDCSPSTPAKSTNKGLAKKFIDSSSEYDSILSDSITKTPPPPKRTQKKGAKLEIEPNQGNKRAKNCPIIVLDSDEDSSPSTKQKTNKPLKMDKTARTNLYDDNEYDFDDSFLVDDTDESMNSDNGGDWKIASARKNGPIAVTSAPKPMQGKININVSTRVKRKFIEINDASECSETQESTDDGDSLDHSFVFSGTTESLNSQDTKSEEDCNLKPIPNKAKPSTQKSSSSTSKKRSKALNMVFSDSESDFDNTCPAISQKKPLSSFAPKPSKFDKLTTTTKTVPPRSFVQTPNFPRTKPNPHAITNTVVKKLSVSSKFEDFSMGSDDDHPQAKLITSVPLPLSVKKTAKTKVNTFSDESDDFMGGFDYPRAPPPRTPTKTKTRTTTTNVSCDNSLIEYFEFEAFHARREDLADSLYRLANAKVYNNTLPQGLSIIWSKTLLKTAGRFTESYPTINGVRQPNFYIELSIKIIDNSIKLKDTLLHEMCHLAALVVDKCNNPPHGAVFKKHANLMMNAFPTVTITTYHDYDIQYKYRYRCTDAACAKEFGRHSKCKNLESILCRYCQSPFEYLGTFKPDGTPSKRPITRSATTATPAKNNLLLTKQKKTTGSGFIVGNSTNNNKTNLKVQKPAIPVSPFRNFQIQYNSTLKAAYPKATPAQFMSVVQREFARFLSTADPNSYIPGGL